jgi:hypothetical protein
MRWYETTLLYALEYKPNLKHQPKNYMTTKTSITHLQHNLSTEFVLVPVVNNCGTCTVKEVPLCHNTCSRVPATSEVHNYRKRCWTGSFRDVLPVTCDMGSACVLVYTRNATSLYLNNVLSTAKIPFLRSTRLLKFYVQ